jgi:diguanylate cyclase (GGDEF)-like protein
MTSTLAITLVVIDDDPDVLRATTRILVEAGYQVITGVCAADALELTRRHRPAMLLLDVMLPDGDGVNIARQLRSDPALVDVFVVLVSGLKTSGQDQTRGLSHGLADGYISRPLGKPEFLAHIGAMLRLRSVQQSLRIELERLDLAVSTAGLGLYDWNPKTGDLQCSDLWAAIFNYTEIEKPTHFSKWFDLIWPADQPIKQRAIEDALHDGTSCICEYRMRHSDGSWRWILDQGRVLSRDSQGEVNSFAGAIMDITQRKQMQDQVHQLAFYDALTNLPSRRLLIDRLHQAMNTSKRSGRHGALMFLDLDNFKSLNDTHGHVVGDLLLMEVGNRIKSCVREIDTVARFGGDEFVVLLSEFVSKSESATHAAVVAEKIRKKLSEPYLLAIRQAGKADTSVEHQCSASIGVSLFFDHETSQDDVLKSADAAMYEAKKAGRNLVQFYASQT